jgi:NTP pyrophosphatase (non-canonical NTP hydrolase)
MSLARDDYPEAQLNGVRMRLNFTALRNTNKARRDEWAARDGSTPWLSVDWSNELAGETGEACNVVKKLRRIETGYRPDPRGNGREELLAKLAEELGDVIICVDLLAMFYDIDLAAATINKFNRTSDEQGLETKL